MELFLKWKTYDPLELRLGLEIICSESRRVPLIPGFRLLLVPGVREDQTNPPAGIVAFYCFGG